MWRSPLLLLNFLISFALLILGTLTLVKNHRKLLNQVFFIFVLATSLWIMTNYFSNSSDLDRGQVLFANHLTLLYPGVAIAALMAFIKILSHSKSFEKSVRVLLGIDFVSFILTLTPLVIADIHRQGEVYAIEFGPLAPLYFGVLLLNMTLIVAMLVQAIKRAKGDEKIRLQTIAWTFYIMLALNFITNAALPYFGGSFGLTTLGPLSNILVVAGLFYSIARHRLFDIQFFVIRALAYLTTIFAVTVFCVTPMVILLVQVLDFQLSFGQMCLIILTGVMGAYLLQYVRQAFDQVAAKFFHRYYYDPQDVLDQLNNALVHSSNMSSLLDHSAQILQNALKPKFLQYLLISYVDKNTDRIMKKMMTFNEGDLIVADELHAKYQSLAVLMEEHNIAVAVRLHTTHEVLGFILLGHKESGQIYGNRDKRLLGTAAGEISISLQNALRFEEIQKFNITLQERIDEATRKLRRTNEKLRQLDETKDDFISMASHQLRTPLTAAKGYLSLVIDGDVGKVTPKQRELLSQAYFSAQRMVYLIADLLNVSRLRTGKFVIESSPVNLAEIVESEVIQLQETAQVRQLSLTFDKPSSFPVLLLDETKLRQVIMNFIDNAIYYTPAGGHITVRLINNEASIELRVEDTGIGVPRAEQHHLFTKFYRANNAKRTRPDGTGLGLFMAKKVVVAQGGAIIFKSQENKGSTFGFTFPKAHLLPESAKHSKTSQH